MTNTITTASSIGLMSGGVLLALLLVSLVTVQPAYAAITSQLDLGSRGSEVTELQQFLASNASIYPQGLVTGYFGPLTEAAVVQFQVAYGISQVGRVGPITQTKINSIMASGLGLDTSAPRMSNAMAQTSNVGATINWITNEPARGQVFYSTSPIQSNESTMHAQQAYVSGTLASNDTSVRNLQSVNIQGLQPNTLYYYLARATDSSGNVTMDVRNTFQTD